MKGKNDRWGIWVVLAVALTLIAGPATAADSVKVRLDWVLRGNHAMFHVAKEKGYFKQNGIDVTKIDPGNGSQRTMKFVGGGQYPFGYGDLPTLAAAKSQGVPVTSLTSHVRRYARRFRNPIAEGYRGTKVRCIPRWLDPHFL